MKNYNKLKNEIIGVLEKELPENLTYHSIDHTLDVIRVCEQYINREEIQIEEAEQLLLGALFHDLGFIKSNDNHEDHSIEMATKMLNKNEIDEKHINVICNLIAATKIPQQPKNKLEQIICDSDLDYLGRDDYYEKSELLFEELKSVNIIETRKQWLDIQLNFLTNHRYHTPFAIENRKENKLKRIEELLKLKEEYNY